MSVGKTSSIPVARKLAAPAVRRPEPLVPGQDFALHELYDLALLDRNMQVAVFDLLPRDGSELLGHEVARQHHVHGP